VDHDYGLALEEARRRLDSQLALVDASRGRAISLLGVGGLLGTFVGGLDAGQPGAKMSASLWVGAAAFGVAVVVGLLVLFPWKFHGAMETESLLGWGDQGASREQQEKSLAKWTGVQVANNKCKAGALQWGLLVIVLALAVEFVALANQLRTAR
jgi:hypothetical protein